MQRSEHRGAKRCRAVDNTYQDVEDKEIATLEFDMVRSVFIFNFPSVRSVIITKLKTKGSQRIDTCKYKIHIAIDGNLMPIRMYKNFFPNGNINDLNKFINKTNGVACLYQLMNTTNGYLQSHNN